MSKKPESISRSRRTGLILRWLLAVVLVFFSIFPVLWIVSAAINPVNDLANQQLIPANANFDNFKELTSNPVFPYFTWLGNSMKVSIASTLLTLILLPVLYRLVEGAKERRAKRKRDKQEAELEEAMADTGTDMEDEQVE